MRRLLGREWIWTTLLVLAAAAVCTRLGIWQLDRLEQRRAFNRQYEAMRKLPPIDLNREGPAQLTGMEWRAVRATGHYEPEWQVALRNQYHDGQYGFHLITPLRLDADRVILVDRGWVPAESTSGSSEWRRYDEAGEVLVEGQLRSGNSKPAFGGLPDATPGPGASEIEVWNNLDLMRIARQWPYPIPLMYIQAQLTPGDAEPPIPYQPDVEISEGPHMGYAAQWFTFAAMLLLGYPVYVRRRVS